jgi:hypothetical protein
MIRCVCVRVFAIACVLLHIAHAHAQSSERVAVSAHDPALIAALGDALAPLQVTAVDDAAPTSIGDLTAASRRLVDREHTRAAIWLISDGGVTTLVAYDRGADRVLVRTVPYATPLDDAQAAVAARSARAMLRALRVDEEAEARPMIVGEGPVAPEPVVEQLATSAGFAVRVGSPGRDANGELALGAIWRPSQLGVAIDLSLALASDLRAGMFEGTIGDRSLGVVARLPLVVARDLTFAASGGMALHAIRFAGDTPMRTIADWHFDPAARVGATLGYEFRDGIDIGLSLSTDYLLRRQRYEVEGEEVIVMPGLQLAAGIGLTIRIL